MIKHLLSSILIASSVLVANAQSFSATYSFAATTTVSGTTDPSALPTATGLTFGAFSAVGTGSNSSGAGRFSFNSWGTGATTAVDTYSTMTGSIDAGKYYEVTLTPTLGNDLTLTNITFGVRRSGTGVRSYALRSSADSYSNNLGASVLTNTNISVVGSNEFFWNFDATSTSSDQLGSVVSLSGPEFTGVNTPISFRFYAWNAEATTGTFSIDNVTFVGSTSAVTNIGKVSFDLNTNFNIYPIPSQDGILIIENKNLLDLNKIEVLDVLGNIVYTSASKSDSKVKLNLSEMQNGNYFVRMYSGNSVSTKKITVIK
jgi:hypothetical protein